MWAIVAHKSPNNPPSSDDTIRIAATDTPRLVVPYENPDLFAASDNLGVHKTQIPDLSSTPE
jgi:hypothetical protein